VACRGGRAAAIVAALQAAQAPFHSFMSGVHSRESCACGGKIVASLAAACSKERGTAGACETEEAGRAGGCSTLGQARRRR